jgi:hypothetical protein
VPSLRAGMRTLMSGTGMGYFLAAIDAMAVMLVIAV